MRTRWLGMWGLVVSVTFLSGCGLFGQRELEVTLQASVVAGKPPLAIQFGAQVQAGAREPLAFRWEFGDGQSGTGAPVSHLYTGPGTFTARVIVTDAVGNVGQARQEVKVLDFSRTSRPLQSGAGALTVGDFNQDGRPDLAAVSVSQGRGWLSVFLNRSAGSFSASPVLQAGQHPVELVGTDLDADGRADLLLADLVNSVVIVFPGNGNGTFRDPFTVPVFKENALVASGPRDLAAGDFNGDGHQDLATVNQTTDNVSVLLGDGEGRLRITHGFFPHQPGDLVQVEAADFDRDGLDDLALLNQTSGQVEIHLSRGDGTFLFFLEFAGGEGPRELKVTDLDGDGFADLIIGNGLSRDVSVWWGRPNALFSFPGRWDAGGPVDRLAALDVDGDRKTDLVTLESEAGKVHVLLAKGRDFERPFDFELGTPLTDLAGEDLNGDGRPDLAVTGRAGQLNLLFNVTP